MRNVKPAVRYLIGDCIEKMRTLPDKSVHCCVTSPPYFGLRDYGVEGQIGLEETPDAYVAQIVAVFRKVWRILRDDGTVWLNLGDSYAANRSYQVVSTQGGPKHGDGQSAGGKGSSVPEGLKAKDLIGIPWLVAFALRTDGWYLRQDIIWNKPNPMPESVMDRCTKSHEYLFLLSKSEDFYLDEESHEYVFLLTKSPRYYYDRIAIQEQSSQPERKRQDRFGGNKHNGATSMHSDGSVYEGGGTRNKRSVWTIPPKPFKGAHFATMPPELVRPCILAGTSERGCCPDCGSPAVRKTETTRTATRPGTDSKIYEPNDSKQDNAGKRTYTGFNARWKASQEIGNRDPQRHVSTTETVGWAAACKCGRDLEEYIPCTVLDPFGGAGTTALVSVEEGRHSVYIELNPEYQKIAEDRILPVLIEMSQPSIFDLSD